VNNTIVTQGVGLNVVPTDSALISTSDMQTTQEVSWSSFHTHLIQEAETGIKVATDSWEAAV